MANSLAFISIRDVVGFSSSLEEKMCHLSASAATYVSLGGFRSVSIVMKSSPVLSLFGNIWFCAVLLISSVVSCSSLSPVRKRGACVGDSACTGP